MRDLTCVTDEWRNSAKSPCGATAERDRGKETFLRPFEDYPAVSRNGRGLVQVV